MDSILSDDNSTITFICHLACQTDFITGCNITLVDACGEDYTQSCTVNDTQTFSPRECSVVFRDLPLSSYDYTAQIQSDIPLQVEENMLNMTGTLVTAGKSHAYHGVIVYSYIPLHLHKTLNTTMYLQMITVFLVNLMRSTITLLQTLQFLPLLQTVMLP